MYHQSMHQKRAVVHCAPVHGGHCRPLSCRPAPRCHATSAVTSDAVAQQAVLEDILLRTAASRDMDSARPRRHWRIRKYCPERDHHNLLQLLLDTFFVPPRVPLAALKQLSYVNFKAEIADGLRKKERTIDADCFQMFVLEDVTLSAHNLSAAQQGSQAEWRPLPAPATPSQQLSGPKLEYTRASSLTLPDPAQQPQTEEAAQLGQQQTTDTAMSSEHKLVGTVEVTLMDEDDVMRYLTPGREVYAYMSSMTVAQSARRQGLAQALLHVAEQQSALWQQPDMTLHVYDDNTPAVQLYTQAGYQVAGRDPGWKKALGSRVRLLMRKALEDADTSVQSRT